MTAFDKLGFIFFPGPKATAYLSVFKKLNTPPSVIIVMKNRHRQPPDKRLTTEVIRDQYFDLNYSIEQFSQTFTTKIIHCDSTHINDEKLKVLLDSLNIENWLFSGGGIIKVALLQHHYRFLHIHPGQLPEVKGSTCFYYSLLMNQSLAASAFFMQEQLDTGEAIAICQFSINLDKETLTPSFLDNIIDPWIRSKTLQKVLAYWEKDKQKTLINRIKIPTNRAYYVAHPILRSLAILKTTQAFNHSHTKGVIEIE